MRRPPTPIVGNDHSASAASPESASICAARSSSRTSPLLSVATRSSVKSQTQNGVKGLELDLQVDDLQVDICGRTLSHTSTVFVQFRVLHRYSSRSAPTWPASSVSIISTLLERVTQYYSGYLNVSVNNLLPYLVLQKTPLNRDSNSESACCRTF